MRVAGVDIGSRTAKAIILDNDEIVASHISSHVLSGPDIALTTINEALAKVGLTLGDVACTTLTGYGRFSVPFGDKGVSEVSCHARGINWYFPSVRTILDIGGQDSKAMAINERGRVTEFQLNEKCAGGTGRFLEVMAGLLGVPLEEIGEHSLPDNPDVRLNSTCVIFAKSEALGLLKKGVEQQAVIAALHEVVANIAYKLLRRISMRRDLSITGGVAHNVGIVTRIREKTGIEPCIAPDPQLIGAIGAALFARDLALKKIA